MLSRPSTWIRFRCDGAAIDDGSGSLNESKGNDQRRMVIENSSLAIDSGPDATLKRPDLSLPSA